MGLSCSLTNKPHTPIQVDRRMRTATVLIGIFAVTLANADKPALPVLYRVDQPNSNVVVFRGADVARARAAGLLPGGPAKASPPVAVTPAPYVPPTTTPYVPPPPPPTTTAAPPPAPVTPKYKPAPVVYKPAPVVYKPAPILYKPAPIVYKPAPPVVYHKPAPVVTYKPAPPAYNPAPASYAPAYADVDPNYTWEYNVDDAHYSHFGHKEARDYYVNLPDGRTQTVTYTADENGYRPVVTYEGEAKYPELVVPKAGYAA